MKQITQHLRLARAPIAIGALLLLPALGAQAATFVIKSRDPAGLGFNDPTPVAPVGGNTGTTLGAQRWIVYQRVAEIWGAALQSKVPITVSAGWEPLACTTDLATLGSAGPNHYWRNFKGAYKGIWFPQALANKIAGANLIAGYRDTTGYNLVDIITQFNGNLGNKGCLDGGGFYLGLDGKAPANQINFMTTLLHEFAHGLGFTASPTNTQTGQRYNDDGSYATVNVNRGYPSVWEYSMYDASLGKTWAGMSTPAQRRASAVNTGQLSWAAPNAVAAFKNLVVTGLVASSPAESSPRGFVVGYAAFGPAVGSSMQLGNVVDTASLACSALAVDSLQGKVALVDRGDCSFAVKAKTVQDAGAAGMILVDNTGVDAAPSMGLSNTDADTQVRIPVVSVSQPDGTSLRKMMAAAAKVGTAAIPGVVNASMGQSNRPIGANSLGYVLLYTPKAYLPGSSVSHWDRGAEPNLLMEPYINADLTTNLLPPWDLTLSLLKDIGW